MEKSRTTKLQEMFSKIAEEPADFQQKVNEFMGDLLGTSAPQTQPAPPSSGPAPDPGQEFQKMVEQETKSPEVYQMPTRVGQTGKPTVSSDPEVETEKNWILSTFINKDVKLNELHPHGHKGIDVAVPMEFVGKKPVFRYPAYPIASGKVYKVVLNHPRQGNSCSILHDNGNVAAFYGHLHEVSVTQGQEVTQNTPIGIVGNTGNAKGSSPHVHLEVRVNGKLVNPLSIMGQPVDAPAKKAEIVKEVGSILNKYAKDRGDMLQDIFKGK